MESPPTKQNGDCSGAAGTSVNTTMAADHDHELNYDDHEQRKVGIMRALVEKQDPTAQEIDDLTIRRFLQARDLDVNKGSALLLNYLSWKRSFVPNSYISPAEVHNQLAHNKVFLQGTDKQGRPVMVVFPGRHVPSKGRLEEVKRFIVFTLQKVCARMPSGQEKFLTIVDLEGWGYSNCDIRAYLAGLSILQDYYPERLGKLLMVHVPYIFMAVWKVVYPFIDDSTKKKIAFVEDKKLKATLLLDIDESQLPDIYGGKQPLVPIQDS